MHIIEGREPRGWGVPIGRVVEVLTAKHASSARLIDRLLHTIISGPIDADKLDYLSRDSARTGTAYGNGIDLQRLSTTVTVIVVPEDGRTRVAIGTKEKGIGPAETVAFARYTMFRAVYWHHSYRAIKAMIQFIVLDRMRQAMLSSKPQRYPEVLREELERFCGAIDDRLFDGRQSTAPASRLPHAEDEILRRIVLEGTPVGLSVYSELAQRRWFKRILVLSLDRDLQKEQRKKLGKLFEKPDKDAERRVQWMRKLLLQEIFQDSIVMKVSELDQGEQKTVMFKPEEARSRFLKSSTEAQLLLLDFPDPERTLPGELRFSVENRLLAAKSMPRPRSNLKPLPSLGT